MNEPQRARDIQAIQLRLFELTQHRFRLLAELGSVESRIEKARKSFRVCGICGTGKPVDEFHAKGWNRCKLCKRKQDRERYLLRKAA